MGDLLSNLARLLDGESVNAIASISGSLSDVLVHPQKLKHAVSHLFRALFVGISLAFFVSPAINERFKLTEKEAIAVSFLLGYTGIKTLSIAEKAIEKEIENRLTKDLKKCQNCLHLQRARLLEPEKKDLEERKLEREKKHPQQRV